MKVNITLIISLLILSASCKHKPIDESEIFNTVCIDGIKHFSIVSGESCVFVPVEIEGEKVRCDQ